MAGTDDPLAEARNRAVLGALALGVALAAIVDIVSGVFYPDSPLSGLAILAALIFGGAYFVLRWWARR